MDIRAGLALQSNEQYKVITEDLDQRANPVDPEAEGDFTSADFPMLKQFFGDSAKVI